MTPISPCISIPQCQALSTSISISGKERKDWADVRMCGCADVLMRALSEANGCRCADVRV
jgi:hypothetical protein